MSQKGKKSKSKVVYSWQNEDVLKWLKKYCAQHYCLYRKLFEDNDICGKCHMRQVLSVISGKKSGILSLEGMNGTRAPTFMGFASTCNHQGESEGDEPFDRHDYPWFPWAYI